MWTATHVCVCACKEWEQSAPPTFFSSDPESPGSGWGTQGDPVCSADLNWVCRRTEPPWGSVGWVAGRTKTTFPKNIGFGSASVNNGSLLHLHTRQGKAAATSMAVQKAQRVSLGQEAYTNANAMAAAVDDSELTAVIGDRHVRQSHTRSAVVMLVCEAAAKVVVSVDTLQQHELGTVRLDPGDEDDLENSYIIRQERDIALWKVRWQTLRLQYS
eukprot:GHVU01100391.1.p1 GENE.GHVU01100391.1~~GHVU01100391.1.p1  ORF type:complete len:215 (+),score=10.04 GHVU01100391.1:56-700(+)